jgi:hypothetical protein
VSRSARSNLVRLALRLIVEGALDGEVSGSPGRERMNAARAPAHDPAPLDVDLLLALASQRLDADTPMGTQPRSIRMGASGVSPR